VSPRVFIYLFVEATEDPYFLRDVFSYMRDYTYFGPDSDSKIANTKAVTTSRAPTSSRGQQRKMDLSA
jgi:hypothetical protein